MQLRTYLAIIRRFWPLVILLPLLSGGLSLAAGLRQPPRYQATSRVIITRSLDGAASAGLANLNDTYAWNTTEFILDDLPQVVTSAAFAADASADLAGHGYAVAPGIVAGSLRADVFHRAVTLTAVAESPALSLALARSAADTLQANGLKYWGRAPGGLQVAVLDPPAAAGQLGGLRAAAVDAVVRAALGLLAAVGLALLGHYLDDRLRSADQAELWTGARVLARIPKE
jgi:hypothetical protein